MVAEVGDLQYGNPDEGRHLPSICDTPEYTRLDLQAANSYASLDGLCDLPINSLFCPAKASLAEVAVWCDRRQPSTTPARWA
jgi:hypothetical protein